MDTNRLSVLQWECLVAQVANGINNLPLGLGNKVECLEDLDIITPNRLLLGRNNNRCPSGPLTAQDSFKRILKTNGKFITLGSEVGSKATRPPYLADLNGLTQALRLRSEMLCSFSNLKKSLKKTTSME